LGYKPNLAAAWNYLAEISRATTMVIPGYEVLTILLSGYRQISAFFLIKALQAAGMLDPPPHSQHLPGFEFFTL